MRMTVVFPAPLGPSNPKIVRAPTSRSTPATATVLPKLYLMLLHRTAATSFTSAHFPKGSNAAPTAEGRDGKAPRPTAVERASSAFRTAAGPDSVKGPAHDALRAKRAAGGNT